MRGLPLRRIATSALSTALVLGIAAPAAFAADAAHHTTGSAARAPLPDAAPLLGQTKALGEVGGVLTPVTALLDAALKADDGQLPADQAGTLGDAAEKAVAELAAAAPAAPPDTTTATTPTLPGVPATDTLPNAPTVPAAPTLPDPGTLSGGDAKARTGPRAPLADVKDDAVAALHNAVASLLAAATSGDAGQVVPAATAVVTGLVNLVTATLLSGGLPAPELPGLPPLPPLPAEPPSLPASPPALPASSPSLPASPPAQPTGALPVSGVLPAS
ncbi:hypothetical protein ACL02U_30030 [Streptomyces sp. MS06]|uniref:hypothetical protein n=1 Tax=Streptomyces sp. MS06 TaxID=3385974 RepID=UPI00399FE21D